MPTTITFFPVDNGDMTLIKLRVGLDSCEILEKLCQPSDLAKKLASTI